MPSMVLVLLFVGGVGLVAAAQRPGAHGSLMERLGGLMLVSGLVGLGFALARAAG